MFDQVNQWCHSWFVTIDQTYNFAACVWRDSSMEGLQAIMMKVTCLICLIDDVIVNLWPLTRLTILPHVCVGTLHMRDEGCKASLHWNKTICCFFGGDSGLHDESDLSSQMNHWGWIHESYISDQLNHWELSSLVTICQTYNFATC
jgi:hypothetical protein